MMKKVMKEVSEIRITKESLMILNKIINEMEGRSFHNHTHILYDICNSMNKKNIIYLEIGTYCGASASLVSNNKNVSEVYSIDIGNPINKEIPKKNVEMFKNKKCQYEYFEGDSKSEIIIEKVFSKIKGVDILFIDGDHTYTSVINDFENYKNLVNRGGYIIFDDYLDKLYSPDVFYAVNHIVDNLNMEEYEIIGSLNYSLIKETNLPDFTNSNEFILKKIK